MKIILQKRFIYYCKSSLSTWTSLAKAFNTKPAIKLNIKLTQTNVGLLQVPELSTHHGFDHLVEQSLERTNNLIEEALNEKRKRKMVEIFDELSNSLCKVADLAECLRLNHPQFEYVQSAELACRKISEIVEKLNTHKKLYKKLKTSVEYGDVCFNSNVDLQVARLFLNDFEQSGIHLPEADRRRVVELNNKILQLGQKFVYGTSSPRKIKKHNVPMDIFHWFLNDGENVCISGLQNDSPNALTREMAYRIFLQPDENQEFLLTELLKSRNELAKVCDFESYAQRALQDSTVQTPKKALQFLNRLSNILKDEAEDDFRTMKKMKKTGELGPWDVVFFNQKARKEWFNLDPYKYAPYFSLGYCMEGLNILLSSLYGVKLVNTETCAGETWASNIYKLAVIHENEGLLGYIYCDFYERQGKPNQDCHFTIKGNKHLLNGQHQNPVVVVVLNLALPQLSSPSLLTPSMVESLFHEMGHAMHSMLGRTLYQHVSGTRCTTDFAEVPSILMEYFASDPRVLRTFAKNFHTGEKISKSMLEQMVLSKHLFVASELQAQVFYSVLDQNYHNSNPLRKSTTETLMEVQENYYGLPYVQNTAWQLRFGHLVGYGAKYYSYLVSRALASLIWKTYFEEDPFNRKQGERYRNECLAHGGGKPSIQLVSDYLQKKITPEILAQTIGNEINEHRQKLQVFKQNG